MLLVCSRIANSTWTLAIFAIPKFGKTLITKCAMASLELTYLLISKLAVLKSFRN